MFDAIVIGGGPAGSTAGYLLAKKGFKVLVLEKYRFPRRKPCAGGLTQYALKLLKDLGLYSEEYIVWRARRAKVIFVRHDARFDLGAAGALTTRELFDTYLAREAESSGVELCEGEPVERLSIKENCIEVCSRKDIYRGRAAIIACGQPNLLGASDGIAPKYGRAIAFEFNAPLPGDYDPDATEFYFDLEEDFYGYFWVFPKGEYANYGVGTWIDTVSKMKEIYGDLFKWIKSIVKRVNLNIPNLEEGLENIRGGIVPVYWGAKPEDLVADRILAIGDAATLVRYVGEGICYALKSAQIAAEALEVLLEEDKLSKKDLLERYGLRLKREVLEELKVTPKIEKAMRKNLHTIVELLKESSEARELLTKMIEHNIGDNEYYEEFQKIIMRRPKFLLKALLDYLH